MARTSNIYIRVEPDIKQEAESVLKEFNKTPVSFASLTKEEFNEAISEGIRDFENGNVYTAKRIKEEMTKVFENDI